MSLIKLLGRLCTTRGKLLNIIFEITKWKICLNKCSHRMSWSSSSSSSSLAFNINHLHHHCSSSSCCCISMPMCNSMLRFLCWGLIRCFVWSSFNSSSCGLLCPACPAKRCRNHTCVFCPRKDAEITQATWYVHVLHLVLWIVQLMCVSVISSCNLARSVGAPVFF